MYILLGPHEPPLATSTTKEMGREKEGGIMRERKR
jgi:hypothetical protein